MSTVYERFIAAVQHREVHPVPVVGWDNAVPITRMYGILAQDYYKDAAVKLAVQQRVIDDFPQIRWVPGFHADYGVVIEASAFGCEVQWLDDDSPFAHPSLTSLKGVAHLKVPDPAADGLMPEALNQYRYMWQHVDRHYIEEYGYLEGFALTLGPLEIAACLRGYESFLMDLYDDPVRAHQLLEITTETALRWVRAQEAVNGAVQFVILVEHMPANLSLAHIEEYAVPYIKRFFSEFPAAVRLYHNEGSSDHYMSRIPEFGAHIFHCGKIDLAEAKRQIGKHVCLMGNIEAPRALLRGTPEEVKSVCLERLRIGAPDSGYLLCTGGAMAPGTPPANLRAMVAASLEYEKERADDPHHRAGGAKEGPST